MHSLGGGRAAVVGGTGFLGSHLVERLVAEGVEVLAVARSPLRLSRLAGIRHDCVVALADVCDAASISRALQRFKPDTVFHLAAHEDGTESFSHVVECMRVNGLGLVNTLQAAALSGAGLFVYGDSAKDYGNGRVPYRAAQAAQPVCSYAIVKSAGWELCQLAASFTPLKVVALRPTFVYGPRQNRNVITYVRECVTAGKPVRLMGGSQTRDPLFIEDAVRAFLAAAESPRAWGHAIPVGGGQELTVESLCEAVIGALGARVAVAAGAEQPRLTEIWRSSSDNFDAFELLGWQPRVTLSEGLTRTVADWADGERPDPPAQVRPQEDCYLQAAAPGVFYRMLDRRDGDDRRALARGGRRESDFVDAALATVVASIPPPVQHVLVPALGEEV